MFLACEGTKVVEVELLQVKPRKSYEEMLNKFMNCISRIVLRFSRSWLRQMEQKYPCLEQLGFHERESLPRDCTRRMPREGRLVRNKLASRKGLITLVRQRTENS